MRQIDPQTKKRIIELWFKGLPRDVIARKVGVSTGTVSNVAGSVSESLKELRALSVELRKSGKSPQEALTEARLHSKLADLSVELDQLQEFVHFGESLSSQMITW